jgi:hypothetical protein
MCSVPVLTPVPVPGTGSTGYWMVLGTGWYWVLDGTGYWMVLGTGLYWVLVCQADFSDTGYIRSDKTRLFTRKFDNAATSNEFIIRAFNYSYVFEVQ